MNSSLRLIPATFLVFCALFATAETPLDLVLAHDGITDYQIVVTTNASGVERYAAAELALYLKQITGADFPIVSTARLTTDAPTLCVGPGVAAARLHLADPLAGLRDQTHIWKTRDRDILLYGTGVHGTLYAVIAFLEDQLGWRWFSLFEEPLLPQQPTVRLPPFDRRREVSFSFCTLELQRGMDFLYQLGANLYVDQTVRRVAQEDPAYPVRPERAFVSALHEVDQCGGNHHTLFSFIPTYPDTRHAATFDWQEKKDYFVTNPEYFSQDPKGQHVSNRQLCFANPNLRAELTRQVLRFIEVEQAREGIDVVSISAMDTPGTFCYCPGCRALEAKHQSPGGPLYDYLFELCALLQDRHPGVRVYTIAYRRDQTQIPPTLLEGQAFPSNLMINFAPIEDCVFADWTHPDPDMQATYRDLKQWGTLTRPGNLLGIFYGPWGAAAYLPFGDVDRLVNAMRLMYAAGVRGVHLDSAMTHDRGLFYELRRYLIFKLRQDIQADPELIIREFTDFMYGPAAPLLRDYLAELEAERKAMTREGLPRGVTYGAALEAANFPYLTPTNLHRWQNTFDRMMDLTADGLPRCRLNVQLARRSLDLATLWKWFDLQTAYPEQYRDHLPIVARIAAANKAEPLPQPAWEQARKTRPDGFSAIARKWSPLGDTVANDLATVILGGGQAKPLPPELAELDARKVKRFVPANRSAPGGVGYPPVGDRIAPDPDAAFGYAATTYLPPQQPRQKLPFTFGVRPAQKEPSVTRSVKKEEITPRVYRLYKLGTVTLTPTSELWMPEWTCSTQLELGKRLYEPGVDNLWDIYVSLKFDGPTYDGSAAEDSVWCDQVILVPVD